MKLLLILLVVGAARLAGCDAELVLDSLTADEPPPKASSAPEGELNVNSRYTVQSVEITGAKESRLSKELREDLQARSGKNYDQEAFDDLAARIRRELEARSVTPVLKRGDSPETVRVIMEVRQKRVPLSSDRPSRFAYHSKHGWTGDLTVNAGGLILGVFSNNEELLERYAGFRVGGETGRVFTPRVRLRFLFESTHQQWNRTTLLALDERPDVAGIYRTRNHFEPQIAFTIVPPLTISFGASFNIFETQFPAARDQSANAFTTTLRYRGRLADGLSNKHDLDAEYELRAATSSLSSDFTYNKHTAGLRYGFSRGKETLVFRGSAGTIGGGAAPLFERYALGHTTMLRGWNKYDVAPLGGTRMGYGSLEYRRRMGDETAVAFYYDTGAVWESAGPAVARHAAGFGLRGLGEGLYFYVGFPLRRGRVEPLFMMGANF